MKVSRTKFVGFFLLFAFVFQFISNSLLSPEVGLFPNDGEWFPGTDSPIGWKSTLAKMIFPFKYVLIRPLSFLGQDPDPAPPVLLLAFACYWAVIAVVIHLLFSAIFTRKA